MHLKNLIPLFLFFFVASIAFGQSSLDKTIAIDVHLNGLQEHEKYYLNSTSEAGIDSARVNKQRLTFSYHGEPNAFIVSTKPDIGSDGSNKMVALFISGEHDISITGHADSLQTIHIAGSRVHDEIAGFNEQISPLENRLNSTPFNATVKRDSLKNIIKDSFKTFIEAHSDSYSGLMLLYQQISDKDFTEKEAKKLLELFEAKYKDSYYYETSLELLANVKQIEVGKQAPDFTCQDLNFNDVSLSDFRGKYVLLEFWSSWCGPCLTEMPFLVNAYATYKNKGFEIIGVSLDTRRETWKRTIKERNLTWTQVSDLKGQHSDMAVLYCVNAIPRSFLIDPEGTIVEMNLRDYELTSKLEEIFEK